MGIHGRHQRVHELNPFNAVGCAPKNLSAEPPVSQVVSDLRANTIVPPVAHHREDVLLDRTFQPLASVSGDPWWS